MTDDTQKLMEEALEEETSAEEVSSDEKSDVAEETQEVPTAEEVQEEVAEPEASEEATKEPEEETSPVILSDSEGSHPTNNEEQSAQDETTEAASASSAQDASADSAQDKTKSTESSFAGKTVPDNAKWYIVHTYAGHENKVAKTLRQRAETMGFENHIFDIIVPTREVTKVNSGKKTQIQEKIFPGYVIVRMVLTDESWILVRTTPGVTAFIGAGNKPTPISQKEVEAIQKFMKLDEPLYKASFVVGEAVKIVDGPFSDFLGTIDSIDETKGKLRVLVSIFGRETPVELDFLQVNKI
ncbi:MAG TPA: transcription termination/antitermination protein NusG [Patescibacteria group bacterium]